VTISSIKLIVYETNFKFGYIIMRRLSIILSTQCHDPYHDSCHKIRHVFIPEKYHPIISFDIEDENLEHNEMSATRHAIVGIQNRGYIGYRLVGI